MATGKQGFVRAAEPQHSVSVQREKEMHVQAPLPAMYIQAVSGLPSYPQTQPAGVQDAAVIPLSVPMMYTNQALPFLTLHIASGAGLQQQRPELPVSSPRPKSAGKHVCPHCGRDCLKPSVLEKHLRCHTGERPYPCSTCGISFKTQSNLYKHKRTQAHARLSSESGKGTFSSQESTESSRENCSSPSLELQKEDSGDTNRNDGVFPGEATNTGGADGVKANSETECALFKAAVVGVIASPAHGQQVLSHPVTQRVPQLSSDAAPIQARNPNGDGRGPLTPNRTPLQRQEALFPKPQSHDSTDSGFSESNEQTSTCSPCATVHDPSMELEEPETSEKLTDTCPDDIKGKVTLQEKQKLEKHILKLISENSVVMDDKDLVNVRPRKTVLSKQGSIDLPMPYTYKDSFHFEIRSSKHNRAGSQSQDRSARAFYSSMPTQNSTSLEHAPLTRSSSLPFSVGIQKSDSTVSPYHVDNVPLSRRCSAGHIYPFNSVDQHTPSHRSLVRQVAVDGLSVAEGSPMERGSLSSLSSDGDCADSASEMAVKRCRRKKAQKFAYNKWYMYGGGTFKKLYNTEKEPVLKSRKSTLSSEQTDSQVSQQNDSNLSGSGSLSHASCSTSPLANVLTAQTSSQVKPSQVLVQNTAVKQTSGQQSTPPSLTKQTNVPSSDLSVAIKITEEKVPETQVSTPIPSERKKQKTDEHLLSFVENTEALIRMQQCESRQVNTNLHGCQPLQPECVDAPQKSSLTSLQRDNGLSLNRQGSFTSLSSSSNQRQPLFKRHSSPLFMANMSGTSASPSASSSISSISQAKTSFLPKYQLKIPVLTDGTSEPSLGKSSTLNPSSPRQNVSLNQQPATSPSTTQNQSAMTAMSSGQEQSNLCITATTTPVTSAVYSCQGANAYTSTFTSTTSSSLASPLAFTDLSATVSTIHSPVSTAYHASTSTKNTTHVSSVQDNTVVIPAQSPGVTPSPANPCSTVGIPLEISSTEIPGSQDTFYVQTADLQIVMQLISDEQLALIEPQIEMQDYKTAGSHGIFSKDAEMSDTKQTGVSADRHKQLFDDARTKHSVEQGNVKCTVLNNTPAIPDITLMSFGSTVLDHRAKSTKSAQDMYVTNCDVKGVISRSPSKAERSVSALLDCKTLGQPCKPLSSTPENKTVLRDSETAGWGISARSYLKQKPSEKPGDASGDKSTPGDESQVSKSSAHDQTVRSYSTSIICSVHQKCQDTTKNHGTNDSSVASTNVATTSSEGKIKVPEISARSPNHHPGHATVHRLKSLTEKQTAETTTSCISVESSVLAPKLTSISASKQEKLIDFNSYQPSGASSATERPISSRSVLACCVCTQHPLNQTGGDRSQFEDNDTSASGQPRQHLVLGKNEKVKGTTSRTACITSAQSEPQEPMSTCLNKENLKCALGPCGMLQVNQDTIAGPPLSCSKRQSLKFQREAGEERQQWIPLEPKSRGGDGPEWLGTCETHSEWTKQDHNAPENKKEEATCTESYIHKAVLVKSPPSLSTSQQSLTDITTPSPELVSISITPSVCGKSSPSHDSKCLASKAHVTESGRNANVAPKQIAQSKTKVKKQVSLGHCERFTSLSRGPGDMRHHLALPSLVTDIQKEKQTKNSAGQLTHSTITQAPPTERETDGAIVLNEPYMTSPCNTEHCQINKTTPVYTRPSCSNQANSSKHPNPISASSVHGNVAEHNASHNYMEEEEERSSSSDDEGKLVIELE